MANSVLQIILNATDNASGVVKQASSNIASSFKEAEGASKNFALGMVGAGAAAAGFLGYGAKIAGDIEAARQGFVTLLGSTKLADAAIAQIKKDAAATPFELPGLIAANQLLTGVTKNAGRSENLLLNVGKAISAMGKGQPELDRIIQNLQQIGTVGKISEMDVRQFGFAGVNVLQLLAYYYGTTEDKASEMVKGSKDAFKDLEGAFAKAAGAGGKFEKAFINQAGTFNQLLSNVKDSFGIFAADLVTRSGVFDILKQAMSRLIDFINQHSDDLVNFVKSGLGWLKDNGPLIAGIIAGALTPAVVGLAVAFGAATLALAPFIAVGALVGLAVQHWDDLTAAVQPAVDWLKQNRDALEAVASVIAFALLPQMVILAGQLIKNTALWIAHNLQSVGNAVVQTYLYITSGWQLVAMLVAQAVQIGINTAAWLAQNIATGISFVLSGQLTAAFIASRLALLAGAVALGVVTVAQWAWNVALSANPIGLIIIGIAALVAGVVLAVGHWDEFKRAALGAIQPVINAVKDMVSWIGKIPGVSGAADSLKNVGKQLRLPGFANGVTNFRGGMALVGEGGPELVNLPRGSSVLPNSQSQNMLNGGPVINIQNVNNYSPTDMTSFARELAWRIS